jgi:hypothetical protein
MPSVSHVSTIWTPSAARGTEKCATSAPSPGSPITAEVATAVAPGDWLQKAFRPDTRSTSPSSTAVVVGHSQSEPPLVAITMPSSATRRRTASASGAPARYRNACIAVRYRCMVTASAVAPSWRASSAWA